MALVDNFESYNVANLVGQGNWTEYIPEGSRHFEVISSPTKTGSRAIKLTWVHGEYVNTTVSNTVGFVSKADGGQTFYFRKDNDPGSGNHNTVLQLFEGATSLSLLAMQGATLVYQDSVGNYSDLGFDNLGDTIWYKITVRWRSSDKKMLYSLNDTPAPIGWTAQRNDFTSVVDQLKLSVIHDFINFGGTVYWDDFSEALPYAGPFPTHFNA